MSALVEDAPSPVARPAKRRSEWRDVLVRSLDYRQMQIGLVMTTFVVLLAILGPLLAPHGQSQILVGAFAAPSGGHLLGGDYLGHDVLSVTMHGGLTVVGLSLAATIIGVGLGLTFGLISGFARPVIDDGLMGLNDVVLSFPQLVLTLVFVSILGPKLWLIVLIVAISHSPRVARLARSITMDLIKQEFVEAAILNGIPRRRILVQEILPNMATPLLVEFGLRLTWSVGLIAGLSFLGYGIQPPKADWGLMINQNRIGLVANPWATLAPVGCIFLFAVGTNLMTEGLSRAVSRVGRRSDA